MIISWAILNVKSSNLIGPWAGWLMIAGILETTEQLIYMLFTKLQVRTGKADVRAVKTDDNIFQYGQNMFGK